ncbi:MAG: hypothetical protein Q9182_007359 [Xanthomendoza sp. 2 TL-2023]
MVSGPDDDFSRFLEFGDLQLSFPAFDNNPQDGGEIQDGVGPAMDMQIGNPPASVLEYHRGGMQQYGDPSALADFNTTSPVFQDMNMQSQLFAQQQQQQLHQLPQHPSYGPSYNGHHMAPPTPNSIEMHEGQMRYQHAVPNSHARTVYEHHRRQPKGQTTFTPLVSPAVTPHDSHFQYSDYAVPSELFSPLTSPALEAQNLSSQRSVYGAVRGSDTSDTTSPIDMNIDPNLQSSVANAARKPRRRTSSAAQRNPQRAVRQSPSMKPQSRKKQLSATSIPPKRVSGIIEDAAENAKRVSNGNQYPGGKLPLTLQQDSSEAESVSPEALSDVLMPPPATPKSASASKSPQIVAAVSGSQSAPLPAFDNEPATPASLMRIRKGPGKPAGSALKEQASMLDSEFEQTLKAITVPETSKTAKTSTKRPALTPLRTADANDAEMTPTLSARKTPRIATTSAPVTATSSTFPSPKPNVMASSGGTLPPKNGDARTGIRGCKKRTNSSSVQVSPALRPRISPSIKPLLPDGGESTYHVQRVERGQLTLNTTARVSAETSALLLASKSNYQNLVEGNHLPGVSYPETLSTNLTSKRTSHKLAEQGRRNRINTALQEMASLLPPTPNGPSPKDAVNGNGIAMTGKVTSPGASVMMTGTAAQQSNSKASTVELAIDYIRQLQGELKDVKARLELAESKVAKKEEQGNCTGGEDIKVGAQGKTGEVDAGNEAKSNDDG